MSDNDVQLSGTGRAFHLKQRKRSSRAFKVQDDEVYFFTLEDPLWKIFEWMKVEFGLSDYELVTDHSDAARTHHVSSNRNYMENLEYALKTMLQLHRSEFYQSEQGCIPANDEKMHDFSHLRDDTTYRK